MKKIISVLMFFNAVLFADWEIVNSPVNMSIFTVRFANSSTGYIGSAAGMIYKTTNGGEGWSFQQLAGLGGYNINEIFINPINSNHVYAAGVDGSFHKTTNAGANWSFVDLGSNNLSTLIFFDLLHGLAASYGTQMYITSNGGNNWTTVSTGLPSENYYSSFLTGNAAYFSASGGKIAKTTNAGLNWTIQNINESSAIFSLYFTDVNTGYAGTDNGKVYQTTNGGVNWFLLSVISPSFSIQGFNSNGVDLYICGNGGNIYKRPAGGNNWYQQVSNYSSSFNDVCFLNEFTGFAVGSNGTIRKTTNGGNPIGIEVISNSIPGEFSLNQNYPNPFNPVTNIQFSVPHGSDVKLIVFDELGQQTAELVNQRLSAGSYKVDLDASWFKSGVYFYRLSAGSFTETKRMILVK